MANASQYGETTVTEEADKEIPVETEEQALALNADGLRYWLREVLLDNVRLQKEIQLSKLARQAAAEMCRKGTPYVEPTKAMTAAATAPVVRGKKSKKRKQEVQQFLDSDGTASGAQLSKRLSCSVSGGGKDEPGSNAQLPSQADAAPGGSIAAAEAPEARGIPGLSANSSGTSQPGSQVSKKQHLQEASPDPRQPAGGHSTSGMQMFPADPRQHDIRNPMRPGGNPRLFAPMPMGAPPPGWQAGVRPGFGFPLPPPRPPVSAPGACPQQGSLANGQPQENGQLKRNGTQDYIAL